MHEGSRSNSIPPQEADLPCKRLLRYLINRNMSHTADISYHQGHVVKRVHRYLEHDVVRREVYWLQLMRGETRTPNLIEQDGNTLKMTYVGEPLSKSNAPHNLKSQLRDIASMLKRFKCNHHDINPGNLMVLDGWISLIDFQWALPMSQKIPENWPKCLNSNFRPSSTVHSDKHSMQRVLEIIGSRSNMSPYHPLNWLRWLIRSKH